MKRGAARILSLALLGALASGSALAAPAEAVDPRPNFVLIFADDMGYGDMGNAGHPSIRTPNLDRLAAEGQKWTNFYVAASVCTPSRAALMTGRLPVRNGMTSSNPRRRVLTETSSGGLPEQELTVAEALKQLGYRTGMIGKWHLGHLPRYLPTRNGFDSWYGIPYSNDMDIDFAAVERATGKPFSWDTWAASPVWHEPRPEFFRVPLMEGEQVLRRAPEQSELTRDYTQRAVEFIRAPHGQPFFLYLAHAMPHVPLFRSAEFRGHSTGGLYGDVIEELDWSVGQIVDALKTAGVERNTLLVFTSDNGPWLLFGTLGGSAGPLTGGKGETFEGGMREPAIFWWPGQVAPGIVHGLGSTLDVLPTLVSLAGGRVAEGLDGLDLSDALHSGAPSPRTEMFYYRGTRLFALRSGRWKAHFLTQSAYGGEDAKVLDTPLLFDLDEDPGERYDLATQHPGVIERIMAIRRAHESGVLAVENQLEKD